MIRHNRLRMTLVFAVLCLTAVPGLAASPAEILARRGIVEVRFQQEPAPADVLTNDGSAYSADAGLGWSRDMKPNIRVRDNESAGVALMQQSVSEASFTIDLPNGDYIVEAASFDKTQPGSLVVMVDGVLAAEPAGYAAGDRVKSRVAAKNKDGKLSITFVGGKSGYSNGIVSHLKITPASTDPKLWAKLVNQPAEVVRNAEERKAKLSEKIARNRESYAPALLSDSGAARQVFDLSGKWLFMPSADLTDASLGTDPRRDDGNWHTLGVPQFWQPISWWIYTPAAGTSHNYQRKENARVGEFTFNWTTRAGWYRHWVEAPKSFEGKRLVLEFDAVSSVTEVYWNGKLVGSHVGMFGPFECEVTRDTRFGAKNLLSVYVASSSNVTDADANKIAHIAVTVPVTKGMLSSIPRGCYWSLPPGIWQPVRLVVSGKDRIADVYFRPRLNGASIETSVARKTADKLRIRHTIVDAATGRVFRRLERSLASAKPLVTDFSFGKDTPKFWSPEHPNLYRLRTQVLSGERVVDEKITTVGFKVFEARGNRLYLNGKPYFMRGSNQPPHGIEMNNQALADKFMGLMHDGNLMTTRFHVAPPARVWMDAADRYGVGTSVGETWPWIMVGNAAIPNKNLLDIWKQEFLDIVKANRNHPSLMLWTISNEAFTNLDPDKDRRIQKERIFSDMIQSIRRLDPETPVVLHSGYVRYPDYYESTLKPNKIDDGDIDDLHCYNGWYGQSPFHTDVSQLERGCLTLGNDAPDRSKMGRPIISQEASTGYPDNDTGHAVEQYTKYHYVPQAWIGQYATYEHGPETFLDFHAQTTKEMCEKIRRDRTFLSGWGLFATTCWFNDVYDADRIVPYPVYWEVKKAWAPVLVSLESPERHFETAEKFASRVFVINDDPDRPKLTDLTLTWRIFTKSNHPGTSGTAPMPDCAYDGKSKAEVEFTIPGAIPIPRIGGTLTLELRQGEKVISYNDYPLILAEPEFYSVGNQAKLTVVEDDRSTGEYLRRLGFAVESVKSVDWSALDRSTCVVLAKNSDASCATPAEALQGFVNGGGRVLLIGNDSKENKDPRLAALPGIAEGQLRMVGAWGDFVDASIPDFISGMDPMDVHWWRADEGDLVRVCRTSYIVPDSPAITKLATHINAHGYLGAGGIGDLRSWPVIELKHGQGRVIVSSMILANDPLARRFYANLARYLLK